MTKFLIKFLCLFIPAKSFRTKFKNCFAATRKPPCRHVGRHTYLGASVFVSHKETSIGSFCSIAGNTAIGPSQHPLNFLSTHPFQYLGHDKLQPEHKADFVFARPVAVGNDVWIGANVVIMDGLTIGDGAVIGANAVVTRDVPPYAIVGGIPARIIRYRFEPEIIEKLLALQWWNLPDEQIAALPFDDVAECIRILEAGKE